MIPKIKILKNWKKNARRKYPFTQVHHKWRWHDVWFLKAQQPDICHFWYFFALSPATDNLENQNFEKLKKSLWDTMILHMCTINDNHIMHGSWEMESGKEFQGCHYFSRLKFKVSSRFLPTFYLEFKVFVHFSRFYKLSNITIITIFFTHVRLSQRYTSTSTLSNMNFIQLYHNARDRHSSTIDYIPVLNVPGLVLTHTQSFPFF